MKKIAALFILLSLSLMSLQFAAAKGLETKNLTNIHQVAYPGFKNLKDENLSYAERWYRQNRYAFSMASFKGRLYVGTLNNNAWIPYVGMAAFGMAKSLFPWMTNGTEVWAMESDGSWTNVVKGGNGNKYNLGLRNLKVIDGYLYGVTLNHNTGMEVWRTLDGETWEVVSDGGFDNTYNTSGRGLIKFNGYIYVGTENRTHGAEIWRSKSGDKGTWELVAEEGLLSTKNEWFSDFAEFNGKLYVGTMNGREGMELYRSADGINFERIFDGGFDGLTQRAAMKLNVFNGKLYITSMNWFKGFSLLSTNTGDRPEDFKIVFKNGGPEGATNRYNTYGWQLITYKNRLYIGTFQRGYGLYVPSMILNGKYSIFSTADGDDWSVETNNAFESEWGDYGIRSMAVHNDKLYIGTATGGLLKPWNGLKIFEATAK